MASSQKFIARNRAPRVQIEYDVELYGAEKKIQLPFVMGVMSDLAGKSEEPQPSIADRKFLEIDVDSFDSRMKSMKPRAAFVVPNTLTGEGNMAVDITFESMDDFSPAAIAAKVEPLKKLLDARTQLANLTTYMDGKTGAEALLETVLQDRALLSALAAGDAAEMDQSGALSSLRATADRLHATRAEAEAKAQSNAGAALDALRAAAPAPANDPDNTGAALDALRAAAPPAAPPAADRPDPTAAAFDALRDADPEATLPPRPLPDALADLLADAAPTGEEEDPLGALGDLLGDPSDDPLADLLADASPTSKDIETEVDRSGIAGLIAPGDDDALAALLADDEPEVGDGPGAAETLPMDAPGDPDFSLDPLAEADDLDDLLGSFAEAVPEPVEPPPPADALQDLDDLLADFGTGDDLASEPAAHGDMGVADKDDEMALLDELLGKVDAADTPIAKSAPVSGFGTLTAPAPSPESLSRPRFNIAIFGDFSGRAARGMMEVGDQLATRRAIALDVDTVEDVIEGFATELVLPIGPDGKGIAVKLGGLDDLHPDALVDNLELFDALKGLRARLSNPSTAAGAVREMQGWGGTFTQALTATQGRSSASSVPSDKTLTDFQKLIGDTTGRLSQPSAIDDLIGQIVGPHIVPGPNPEAEALKASVDAAMSAAMRLVLHHPEFQAIESQWRLLDLLARRVETDLKLTITLYDVSAAEIAADLAGSDDLAQSGLFRLLNAPLQEEGTIGFSALCGLYSFEETPPHAELLARVSKIAAHVQAPFFAAMTPGFMDTALRDRHPLTAKAWDNLRAEPSAAYLGLASPRFLLRRPYGKKTEPIDAFDFEEFTQNEGLRGMLWANPVGLVAILLAQSWKDGGPRMSLGQVMSLDDVPFHFVNDKHGDQVALPCTERNLTESVTQRVMRRGFMPVVSIRGRDVVRLASFQSLAGQEIAGPWSGAPALRPAPVASPLDVQMEITPEDAAAATDDLDALLAGFGEISAPTDPDSIDAELAALLEGL